MNPSEDVAIFWDYENCPAPSTASGYAIVNNIFSLARPYGSVKLFKAYLDISEQQPLSKSLALRSELQCSGVSLIDCPHNGRKDVADKMMLVDMLAHAIDNPSPSTVFLISGDRDFAYALSILRLRRYRVILVTLQHAHMSLIAQASQCYYWATDVVGQSVPSSIRQPEPNRVTHERQRSFEPVFSPSPAKMARNIVEEDHSAADEVYDTMHHLRDRVTRQSRSYSQTTFVDLSNTQSRKPAIIPASAIIVQDPAPSFSVANGIIPPVASARNSCTTESSPPSGIDCGVVIEGPNLVPFRNNEIIPLDLPAQPAIDGDMMPPLSPPSYESKVRVAASSYERNTQDLVEEDDLPDQGTATFPVERPSSAPPSFPSPQFLFPTPQVQTSVVSPIASLNVSAERSYGEVKIATQTPVSHPSSSPHSTNLHQSTSDSGVVDPAASISSDVVQSDESYVPAGRQVQVSSIVDISPQLLLPSPNPKEREPPHPDTAPVLPPSVTIPSSPTPMPASHLVVQLSNVSTASRTASDSSSTSMPSKPAVVVVPPIFAVLVKTLQSSGTKGFPRPVRSFVSEKLAKNGTTYQKAGVTKFGQYITLAEKEGIVQLGGQGATAWVCLQPKWNHAVP